MRYSIDLDGLALNFVHKRILGGVKGFVSGGPLGALGGFVSGGGGGRGPRLAAPTEGPAPRAPARPTVRRSTTARPSERGAQEQEMGKSSKFGNIRSSLVGVPDGCIFPTRRDPRTGQCKVFVGTQSGRDSSPAPTRAPTRRPVISGPVGDAVMGQYGAGLVPGNRVIDRAECIRGMILGNDGLCYNRGQISNRQRMWPMGRKPLLTGGDMRAISIASSAAKRLERTTKRLQGMGLLKKPRRR